MRQGPEVAASHLAIYAIGAVALPMSALYGPQTIEHILGDCAATAAIVDAGSVANLRSVRPRLAALRTLVVHGDPDDSGARHDGEVALTDADAFASTTDFEHTTSTDPALLLYTSGSTGHPKGALHAHRILDGYLLTFRLFFNIEFDESSRFYTPSDWAWVGGLLDILLPALALGFPVVADERRFNVESSIELMAAERVTHAFLTPTALKLLAQAELPEDDQLILQVIASGGESVPDEIHRWCHDRLGAVINEFYGLTEVNHLIGGCQALWPDKPGWMGLPYPGRTVQVLRPDGTESLVDEVGEIGVRPGDPTQMIGYWNNDAATAARMRDGWIMTGDQAVRDVDGYIRFLGRNDDMIASAGYRIGPAEVEECLLRRPEVAEVAVIPRPDPVRGSVVSALIVLSAGVRPSPELTSTLQQHVKSELAAYKYPRHIKYVDDLPKTTTGKINRRSLTALENS